MLKGFKGIIPLYCNTRQLLFSQCKFCSKQIVLPHCRNVMFMSSRFVNVLNKPMSGVFNERTVDYKQFNRNLSQQPIPEKCVASFPLRVQPYLKLMRLDKPTGALLLMWPSFWGIGLATSAGCFPSLTTLAVCGAGAFIMRGAGCTINDMWDKDFDSQVMRTKHRPLASGELSVKDACFFLGGQLGVASLILLSFDFNSILLGVSSLLLISIYPLMKRFTYWPQLVLGMTFNWGILLGWSIETCGNLDPFLVLPLYFAGICWTLIYDTIYAHQDKSDDLMIGLKSTAIKFGDDTTKWLSGFSFLMCSGLLVSGFNAAQCWPFYLSIGIIAGNLFRQISTLNINDPQDCWNKFKKNTQIGWILFLGISLSTYLKQESNPKDEKNRENLNSNPNENSRNLVVTQKQFLTI